MNISVSLFEPWESSSNSVLYGHCEILPARSPSPQKYGLVIDR